MIRIQGISFELLEDFREGWKPEVFKERYSDILGKFDYIVGDWGYGQLRLKGLFNDNHPKATFDNRISFMDEYIQEYCNFGCPYFLIKKVSEIKPAEIED